MVYGPYSWNTIGAPSCATQTGQWRPERFVPNSMRIALVHIRHAYSGGVERYLNEFSRYLANRGHDVHIVCRRHDAAPHPDVRFERVHGFALGKTWRIWTFARDVERHVRAANYDAVYSLGRTWSHDILRLGGGLHQTYLELAHDAKLSPFERLTGGGFTRHRLVLAIERRAFAPGAYHTIVANSHMVRRDVEARFAVPRERIEVIHNGVDVERFHPRRRAEDGAALRRELGLGDELVVLFLGTGFGRKGLDLALDAFAPLARERADARMLVVGHDSGAARFVARANRLGLGDAVRFLGPRRDPEACYAAADLYLLPTRYDPFANSTVEALASGLPVVTSATNGGAEILDERVGSVLDVADVEGWVDALRRWSEPETLAAGRIAARALAEQHAIETKLARAEDLALRVAASDRPTVRS